MKIVALDVGKFKTVFVVRVTGGKEADRFGKIATAAGAIHDLPVQERPDRMVLESIERNIQTVEAKLDEIAAADQRVALVRTAPCVGPQPGELVVALLDDAKRFKNRKQVGAYAGLTPRVWQSGESMREGHISLMGDPLLRAILTELCWLGVRRDGWIKRTYENVRRGSDRRKKVAIIAVARRLLIRLWAMLRDGVDRTRQQLRSAAWDTPARRGEWALPLNS